MDDSISGLFDSLKISAFSKVKQVNSQIKDVTLGPNSSGLEIDLVDATDSISMPPRRTKPKPPSKSTAERDITFTTIKNELEFRRQNQLKQAVNSHVNAIINFDKQQQVRQTQKVCSVYCLKYHSIWQDWCHGCETQFYRGGHQLSFCAPTWNARKLGPWWLRLRTTFVVLANLMKEQTSLIVFDTWTLYY